jgi:apolipoprotein N-acyltransferase
LIVIRLNARFPLQFLLAFAAGVLHAIAFLDDAGWPLELAALAALFALVGRADRPASAARTGFQFGLGWFLVGISWVYVSMHTYGEMAAPLAALATLLFCAFMSLYPALACGAAAWLARRLARPAALYLLLPGTWCISEMLRGWVFTGFPWIASGYAHIGGPLSGYAPWLGVYGTGFAAAIESCALAVLAQGTLLQGLRQRVLALALVVAVPLLGMLAGSIDWTSPVGQPLTVRLLQGNIPQDVKFDPQRFDSTVATYMGLVEERPADLIVLPETAFPRFFSELPQSLLDRLLADSKHLNAAIALGVPVDEGRERYTNSVVAFTPGSSQLQRYDKRHLVPFGEFVPYGFHWFIQMLSIPLGDFDRGAPDQGPLTLAGQPIAFDICYEDLFGEEIIAPGARASVLVNVSNVAWFGDSMALPQHLAIARMRALETGRPMLRATNTGMTASIDARGRVEAVMKPFTTGALEVRAQPMSGLTPFDRFGNAPTWVIALVAIGWPLLLARRDRQ